MSLLHCSATVPDDYLVRHVKYRLVFDTCGKMVNRPCLVTFIVLNSSSTRVQLHGGRTVIPQCSFVAFSRLYYSSPQLLISTAGWASMKAQAPAQPIVSGDTAHRSWGGFDDSESLRANKCVRMDVKLFS